MSAPVLFPKSDEAGQADVSRGASGWFKKTEVPGRFRPKMRHVDRGVILHYYTFDSIPRRKESALKRIRPMVLIATIIFFMLSCFLTAQPELPSTELPVLITSCGQSPGATMLKVIFMRLKIDSPADPYEVSPLAAAEDLQSKKQEGRPYKSLIIVMGASLKGMGAAGISIDDELKRTEKLLAEARRLKITVIGAHIEGIKRRAQGASVGDNTDEMSIDAVAPNCDLLIIKKEGNQDDRFTIIAREKNIPMIEVEKNLDLIEELGRLFKQP